MKTPKYKIKVYDALKHIYLLYEKRWYGWSFVIVGNKTCIEEFVASKKGILVNADKFN